MRDGRAEPGGRHPYTGYRPTERRARPPGRVEPAARLVAAASLRLE